VALRSSGTELSIAVEDLQTGMRASIGGDVLHVSASSAKAWWVAAAIGGAGVDAVAPYADPIFRSSDNAASGYAIDLVGPDAVNAFLWDRAAMMSTALTQWSYGTPRVATNSPRLMGWDNYTTAGDATTFLALLHRGQLLDETGTAALLSWLTLSPNSGVGGWLVARLPTEVQASVEHKAGWLPPGCCSDDRAYNTLNEVGIVTAGDGRAYAVSILARRGESYWTRQAPFVEMASCSIFRAFTQDELVTCENAADPAPEAGCGSTAYTGYCDGNAVVWCEGGGLHRKDCDALGRTCGYQDDAVGYNCLESSATACGDVTYLGYCDGSNLVWCENDQLRRKDCSPQGEACGYQDDAIGYNCL
jgi:beta-lactamase class A